MVRLSLASVRRYGRKDYCPGHDGKKLVQVFFLRRCCRFRMKRSVLPPANAIFDATFSIITSSDLSTTAYLIIQMPKTCNGMYFGRGSNTTLAVTRASRRLGWLDGPTSHASIGPQPTDRWKQVISASLQHLMIDD